MGYRHNNYTSTVAPQARLATAKRPNAQQLQDTTQFKASSSPQHDHTRHTAAHHTRPRHRSDHISHTAVHDTERLLTRTTGDTHSRTTSRPHTHGTHLKRSGSAFTFPSSMRVAASSSLHRCFSPFSSPTRTFNSVFDFRSDSTLVSARASSSRSSVISSSNRFSSGSTRSLFFFRVPSTSSVSSSSLRCQNRRNRSENVIGEGRAGPRHTPATPPPHHTTPHDTTRHHTTPHDTTRHDTTRHHTTRHDTTRHDTTLHHTTPHQHPRTGTDKQTHRQSQGDEPACH